MFAFLGGQLQRSLDGWFSAFQEESAAYEANFKPMQNADVRPWLSSMCAFSQRIAPMCINLTLEQRATLARIREIPARSDISWSEIIQLLKAIGTVKEYDSRVFVVIPCETEDKRGVLHRRSRQRNAHESTVQSLQDLLMGLKGWSKD